MFAPQTKLLHEQPIITQTTHNHLALVANQISCIPQTQSKTKNSMLNNSNLVVAKKQLVRLLVIQKLIHLEQHRNPSPKHKKPKHLHDKEHYKT
jgi:hypothetical protein